MESLQPLCFRRISWCTEIDVVEVKSRFADGCGGAQIRPLATSLLITRQRSKLGVAGILPQLPLRSCASAKNRSFHDAGKRLRRPTLYMNSACFIRLAGVVV